MQRIEVALTAIKLRAYAKTSGLIKPSTEAHYCSFLSRS